MASGATAGLSSGVVPVEQFAPARERVHLNAIVPNFIGPSSIYW